MDEDLKQEFKRLILHAFYHAQYAHNEIFSDRQNNPIIMGDISIATSYVNAARAVYICNEVLSRQEFDDFFNQHQFFAEEVMENIRTNHSHQWSDIHFNRLKEAYAPVASLLGVVI